MRHRHLTGGGQQGFELCPVDAPAYTMACCAERGSVSSRGSSWPRPHSQEAPGWEVGAGSPSGREGPHAGRRTWGPVGRSGGLPE